MKVLKIEIKGVEDLQAQAFLNAISDVKKNSLCANNIDISYSYKEDDSNTVTLRETESTPFSRYLQSTTPEGRT